MCRWVCGTVVDQIADTVRTLPSVLENLIGAGNVPSLGTREEGRSERRLSSVHALCVTSGAQAIIRGQITEAERGHSVFGRLGGAPSPVAVRALMFAPGSLTRKRCHTLGIDRPAPSYTGRFSMSRSAS